MKNTPPFKNNGNWPSTNVITMWSYELVLPSLRLNTREWECKGEIVRERERVEWHVREKGARVREQARERKERGKGYVREKGAREWE